MLGLLFDSSTPALRHCARRGACRADLSRRSFRAKAESSAKAGLPRRSCAKAGQTSSFPVKPSQSKSLPGFASIGFSKPRCDDFQGHSGTFRDIFRRPKISEHSFPRLRAETVWLNFAADEYISRDYYLLDHGCSFGCRGDSGGQRNILAPHSRFDRFRSWRHQSRHPAPSLITLPIDRSRRIASFGESRSYWRRHSFQF
jgi:hypothetical protein